VIRRSHAQIAPNSAGGGTRRRLARYGARQRPVGGL